MSKEKDDLRAALLGTPKFKTKEVEHNGKTFFVRQPSAKVGKLISKSEDNYERLLTSVIESVYVRTESGELGERAFDRKDAEVLMEQPQDEGSLLLKVMLALGEVSNLKEAKEDAKNP